MVAKNKKIIFAGGGTGGHIYPGIALAQYLKNKSLNTKDVNTKDLNTKTLSQQTKTLDFQESIFIGSNYGLEKQILSNTEYKLKTTFVRPFNQKGIFFKIKSIFIHLPIAILQAIILLIKIKPKCVLSLGSYAAVPVGIAAFLLRIPLFTWEPNAKAGLANRLLSYFSRINFIVFKEVKNQLKGECLAAGLPLRKEITDNIDNFVSGSGVANFSQDNLFKILIVGGSLGSDFLNTNFCKLWSSLYNQPISIIHQTGSKYFTKTQQDYKIHDNKNLKYKIEKYLPNIYNQYRWANLVIARAGIGTLSELSACKKASLLIPYSLSADNHQYKNAKSLEQNNQALMIEEKNFSTLKAKSVIENFIQNPKDLLNLEKNIASFYKDNSKELIINKISDTLEI
ncbi:MAG: UDP-N-acetylglucosamine--N-acetylmuramyl-(pentapeptide) pyrophosphoryl-undecaprenol N-acetylglucosamine transferase [Bdellovibrionales bacterium]|nr:UDP-N-acetylglucosamine--N-acetylmuramyl-(pentapeptide) pyrophosphoryl-undecaprenol N-acetylglucosamine transferase [Bdellovibrionales bacterium]